MRLLPACLFLLCAAVSPILRAADEPSSSATSSTTASGDKKNDPFGMGLTKGRPKNAKTEITAKKEATFDNATSVAEFTGNVVVKDPQFTLFCDRLKVTMAKDRKGLQLVEAFGDAKDGVIIVQDNKDDSGKTVQSIGRAKMAVYDPNTGDVTLSYWPSVQHDINLQISLEEGTIMKLNRSGRLTTTGPSRTVIVDKGDQNNQ